MVYSLHPHALISFMVAVIGLLLIAIWAIGETGKKVDRKAFDLSMGIAEARAVDHAALMAELLALRSAVEETQNVLAGDRH